MKYLTNFLHMKKLFLLLLMSVFISTAYTQELQKDVQKVYDYAEKLKGKGEYKQAVLKYKEVLRSVSHVPSMISIGDIQMDRLTPHYREAYEYYDMAINALTQAIPATEKKSAIKYMTKLKDETIPKRNKAKSFVEDFDKAKEQKEGGSRLLEDPDLKE